MFKTPCCGENISWWAAVFSRPAASIKCPNCEKEYYDASTRKNRRLFYLLVVLSIVSLIASLVLGSPRLETLGLIFFGLVFIVVIVDETKIYRTGLLTGSTKTEQYKDRWKFGLEIVVAVVGIIYLIVNAL